MLQGLVQVPLVEESSKAGVRFSPFSQEKIILASEFETPPKMCFGVCAVLHEVEPPEFQMQRHENAGMDFVVSLEILEGAHQELPAFLMMTLLSKVHCHLHRPMRPQVSPQFFCRDTQALREVVHNLFGCAAATGLQRAYECV
ncbi:MAG: hypothetical protein M3285_02885 [Actinomycetota bacterium]|nr:hypothetical protein [Actinomycetota bacterium]MDQ3954477.1 hypothetical protein [Actinomycetota bacterium]